MTSGRLSRRQNNARRKFQLRIPYWYVPAAPLLLLWIGLACNQIVLLANHGAMPVLLNPAQLQEALENKAEQEGEKMPQCDVALKPGVVAGQDLLMLDDVHAVMDERTHLNWLGDYVLWGGDLYSPGDLLAILGDWLIPFATGAWLALIVRAWTRAQRSENKRGFVGRGNL